MTSHVVYVHGAGGKPEKGLLKHAWDQDLFGRDMDEQTRMAYYADLLGHEPEPVGPDACAQRDPVAPALAALVASGALAATDSDAEPVLGRSLAEEVDFFFRDELSGDGQKLALQLIMAIAARAGLPAAGLPSAVLSGLPLVAPVRRQLLSELLSRVVPDVDAYFFKGKGEAIRQRLTSELDQVSGSVTVVGHSLGTIVAYDVLVQSERSVSLLVSLGSPLGYEAVQQHLASPPPRVPPGVQLWLNFADPFDFISLDTTLRDDFRGGARVTDIQVDNPSRNNHAICGYLRQDRVRAAVTAALARTGPA